MSLLSVNLVTFLEVVRKSTVHGAASSLGVTQTGVTQRIRSLEKDLGVTLFRRSRAGMTLTAEGEAVYSYCLRAKELEGEALAHVYHGGIEKIVDVSIVGPTSTLLSRTVNQCKQLYINWPRLNLNFIFNDSIDLIQLLKSSLAQFAIVNHYCVSNELDSKILKPEKFCLVASYKWKGRRLKSILENERVIDFFEEDKTTIKYLEKYELLKYLKQPRIYINNNNSLVDLIISGIGFGTLSKEIAMRHAKNNELIILNSEKSLEVPLALCWYPRPEAPNYFKDIIKCIN